MPPEPPADTSESWPSDTSSLVAAIESEENKLVSRHFPHLQEQFYSSINAQKGELEDLICNLLQVPSCRIIPSRLWRSGSFNVAILVRLPFGKNVYLRLPFLHRLGEHTFPGNAEEKLRTEIATYLWLQEHCPDVPIPSLYAFGFPDGSIVRSTRFKIQHAYADFLSVLVHMPQKYPVVAKTGEAFKRHNCVSSWPPSSNTGKSLALSWREHYQDKTYTDNLFRGLARVALPLNLYMHMVENEGVPIPIPRQRTYLEVESYLSDLLSLQDTKLQEQPNAMLDTEDGRRQMAAIVALRATMHRFIDPGLRQGPFYLTLTDLHQSNIFVDEHWNIKAIIDLEWTHTLPAEMQTPPYWLTSRAVDGLKEPLHLQQYEEALENYLTVYMDEEIKRNGSTRQADLQRRAWRSGSFWFFKAATIPKGMYNLFNRHIQPMFNQHHPEMSIFNDVFYWYWGLQASDLIDRKLEEREEYVNELRKSAWSARDSAQ
ncbi:hypothetical protein CCM_09319 [Cordyceps militaris CM01]|uniref:Aminoglycoside phosphotransferase domain-containing protein n=1 Tax=Cordyceps militaris (strain CM01) TaxID=983644 RepID=G3JU29_CORMM|nr:uncharacterized protein CCM_09319 [Cordyceps militaris CM01]EGX88183.1 hypothetical protein CCM_09319 [Cordyceps militaris CM01]